MESDLGIIAELNALFKESQKERSTNKINSTVNEQTIISDLDDEETQDATEIIDSDMQKFEEDQFHDLGFYLNNSTKNLFIQILDEITSYLSNGRMISEESKQKTIESIDKLMEELNSLETIQISNSSMANETNLLELQIGIEMIEQLMKNKNFLTSEQQSNEFVAELIDCNNNLTIFLTNFCDDRSNNAFTSDSPVSYSIDHRYSVDKMETADQAMERQTDKTEKVDVKLNLIENDLALSDDD